MYSETITNHVNNRGYNLINVVENVMTHELGHVMGLRDGTSGSPLSGSHNGSVMNSNRSRNRCDVPTNFDVTSVRMIYN